MVLVQKWPFFQLFFLGNTGQENVFYHIIEPKNVFLGYQTKKFKRSKNWHFSKGVITCFWSKNGHFFNLFFFRQYRPGKCLLRCSRSKKHFSFETAPTMRNVVIPLTYRPLLREKGLGNKSWLWVGIWECFPEIYNL